MSTPKNQYTPGLHNTQYHAPNMLTAALWWAGKGWAVGTGHEPLFNHPQGYRCTCEAYRHSDRCKEKHHHLYLEPGKHCANPGKHPRGLEHGLKDFTTDPDKIRAMWAKYPNANILGVPGSADCITLDADSYKPEYAGNGLTADELTTPINISGNGGEHLIFRKHPGATYSNRTGNLPDGIDIRGDDGYIVLPPSLHYSGNRYQMKPGHEFSRVEPQLLPQRIHDALTAATEKAHRPGRNITLATLAPAGPRPDLAQWGLADATIDRIHHPANRGDRSQHDYAVALALLTAGATADDIHAVFAHYPVGTQGKYAERGIDYLQRTIDNAVAWLEEHPAPTRPADLYDMVTVLLDMVRYEKFADRTAATDKAVAAQLLKMAYSQGKLTGFTVSFHDLAVAAGVAVGNVRRILDRLVWFVTVERPDNGKWRYSIAPELLDKAQKKVVQIEQQGIGSTNNVTTVQSRQLFDAPLPALAGHDLYSRSLSAITPDELTERNTDRAANDLPPMKMTRTLRNRLAAAVPSLGKNALRIVDLLAVTGPTLEYKALAEDLQMSRQTVSRLTGRLAALGIIEKDTHDCTLLPDWQAMSDAMAGVCANAGAEQKRKLNRCDAIMWRCGKAMITADADRKAKLQRFYERLRNEKTNLLAHEIPNADPDRLAIASQVSKQHRTYIRWDYAEINAGHHDALTAWMTTKGEPLHERRRLMLDAMWSPSDILAAQRLERGLFGARCE